MPQSLAKVYIHLTFSTRDRKPFLATEAVRNELHAYMAAAFKTVDSPALTINSTKDHTHALFLLSRTHTIAKVVEEIKQSSSKWIKTKGRQFSEFHWQAGYGAFSVSPSKVDEVVQYIKFQEQHHRKRTFQEEFRRLLNRHGIDWDERYVWD